MCNYFAPLGRYSWPLGDIFLEEKFSFLDCMAVVTESIMILEESQQML